MLNMLSTIPPLINPFPDEREIPLLNPSASRRSAPHEHLFPLSLQAAGNGDANLTVDNSRQQ